MVRYGDKVTGRRVNSDPREMGKHKIRVSESS